MTGSQWQLQRASLGPDTARWRLLSGAGAPTPFATVISLWAADARFRQFWASSLRGVPFAAYCWECPPVSAGNSSRPFECVFLSSPPLAGETADPEAFAEHLRTRRDVAAFRNLGGDALLVAPCPGAPGSDFSHLASFVATATPRQADALWRAVGEAMRERLGTRPVWLSTAGLGVAWLHVRLDDRPKYYRHAPYTCG